MHFRNLDLNQLVSLNALLTERSVTRAAERLYVTQSAMSAALARLRVYFGDELLVKVGRQMQLTPFAEQLSGSVREVIIRVQTVISARPQLDISKLSHEMRIVASDFVASVLLPSVLRRISREAPGLQVEILPVMGTRFLEQLERGEIDILIIPEAYASEDLPFMPLFSEKYCCIVDADAAPLTLSLEGYFSMRHIAVKPFMYDVDHLSFEERHIRQSGRRRQIDVTAPNFTLMPELIVGTKRIATVHTRLAQQYIKHWPLKILPCPIDIPPLVEGIQSPPHLAGVYAVTWVRGLLKEEALNL
ncbi:MULTISPECIES: LysR family transcriptional regulator [unclassified Bradyrhizobium]|uniref:LysR family transcriptional regulator n=1 Tax=unclassified Bradyrhizobium TaxID=2631580 RepID=UPI00247A29A9|nr:MULTISPECIES: LysR family transcriptional regulator [unclassified Bradyrhizobium]WGR73119.1 LysR family transcriptional regulator [Bradyrhizobium sp. ISRA426]WGR77959.1 LysR family transcriptional regulator [Bradyrhizobium sp. ISRA430]WGR88360.1 LysR family transcriptional regulator [Bradyrhizobium sp. ISRA432]